MKVKENKEVTATLSFEHNIEAYQLGTPKTHQRCLQHQ